MNIIKIKDTATLARFEAFTKALELMRLNAPPLILEPFDDVIEGISKEW